ncbi:MAG: T9SS C-terminal target domain-containing protein, partial [Candidatus Zixiibacteriota bacterium]
TSIDYETKIIPKNYILKQNYPNPFNNSTVIEFSLPDDEYINLSVYDILGRKVDKLIDGKLTAGQHRITWCNKDVSSGIYFYVLKTEKVKISRMMTILK